MSLPKLDRARAAHKRRARLIAQLQNQAIAAANNDLQQNAIKGGITEQKAHRMIIAAMLVAALGWLGCIFVLWTEWSS